MEEILIPRPDDWHVHLRDGDDLPALLAASARWGRVLAMPNTVPPVTTTSLAAAYLARIRAATPHEATVEPKLAAYLTDHTDADDLEAGFEAGVFLSAKWYPAKATTHSDAGVTHVDRIRPVLERMAAIGMPLSVHGEVTDRHVDVFDREKVFLDQVLGPLLDQLPLRCVVEHATTREAVQFVRSRGPEVAATLTPHHLWWNRNALFDGGLRPHAYCLPVLKREEDRLALLEAATSGEPCFFAGTDSAPHTVARKEQDCGCAGVFNAPSAVAAYTTLFEHVGVLERLPAFLSVNGAAFYGLAPRADPIRVVRKPWRVPELWPLTGGGSVRVFLGGETLPWTAEL